MDAETLLAILSDSIRRSVADHERVAIAYSGGLDSAVVELLASRSAKTRCYTCAVRGSHDHRTVPVRAEEQGVEWHMIILAREDIEEMVSKTSHVLGTYDPVRIAYTMPIICVMDKAKEDLVLAGNGADELFGGYARYLEDGNPSAAMEADIPKMLSEIEALRRYAASLSKRLDTPFASDDVVSFARALPLDRKISGGQRKVIVREVAKSLGVLSYDAPKKAAQYSSGLMREMMRAAKASGMGLGDWTASISSGSRRIP